MMRRIVINVLKLVAAVTTVYVMAVILLTAISPRLIPNEEEDYDLDEDVF